jgi:GTP pyrophosphokinase
MTSKHSYGPSQDWLKLAQSSHAKNKIRQYFKKQRREENVDKGKELVEKEIRGLECDVKEVCTSDNLKRVAEKYNFSNAEDMYAAVGYNGITAAQVAHRLTDKFRKKPEVELTERLKELSSDLKKSPTRRKDAGIRVKGVDNLLIRLSKCCSPVPGDDIVGYITKGRGVSVHRRDCGNMLTDSDENRFVEVEWAESPTFEREYNVDIEIFGFDRRGLLNEVLSVVNETKTNISAVTGRNDRNKMATITMSLSIRNINHLQKVVDKVKQIPDIYSVRRIFH